MSWSSEYEPSTDDFASPGRTLSYQPDKVESSDVARDTLTLSGNKPPKSRPPWLLIAVTIILAILAAGLIGFFFFSSPNEPDDSTKSEEGQRVETVDEVAKRLDTTQISFVPGTPELTATGKSSLASLRDSLAQEPSDSVLGFTVRTYSEDTAAGNFNLSVEQVDAITTFLLDGSQLSPDQISGRAAGSAAISNGDQLNHFVSITAPTADDAVQSSLAKSGNFAFVGDPSSWDDPSNTSTLASVVETLLDNDDININVQVYQFENPPTPPLEPPPPEAETPEVTENSRIISNRVVAYLTENGVTESTINVQAPEGSQATLTPAVGTIVTIVTGPEALLDKSLNEASEPGIQFTPNTGKLEDHSAVEDLADAIKTSNADIPIIINVHTFSQTTAEENQKLSDTQAGSVVKHLVDLGVPNEQLRARGNGNSDQFDENGKSTIVTLTTATPL